MQRRWITGVLAGCMVLLGTTFASMAAETDSYRVTTLDTVVVTASRSQEALREVTSNVTIITQEQIELSTAGNMEELLTQNGFYTIEQGTSKLVQIRGMNQPSMSNEMRSPILVLLNGRRIGANNVNLMGLANVERVEIIRGPAAVQYGPSAMGGVINIITKRGLQNDFSATMEGGIGSYNLHKESLSLNGGIEGFDFAMGIINYGRDDFDMHDGKKRPKSEIDYNTNVNLDLGYNFNEVNRLGVNLNYYDFKGESGPSYSNRQTYTSWSRYDLNNYNVTFMYDGGTQDRMFNWSAAYAFGENEEKGQYIDSVWGDSKSETNIDIQTGNAQIGYNGNFVSIDLGADYTQYDYKGTYLNKGYYKDYGVYLASKLRLFDQKLIFSLGGRYDYYKTRDKTNAWGGNDNHFSPSVGVAFLPVNWLKFRTNYSEGFKMASADQISGNSTSSYTYIPNSSLKPEKSQTWEVGADVDWRFVNASLTYFYTDWKDKITGIGVGPSTYQYKNIKAATLSGLEFAFSADIGKALNWQAELRPYINFTYMLDRKNKDKTNVGFFNPYTRDLPNVPDWMLNFGVTYVYSALDLKTNINAVYTGKMTTMDYRNGSMWAPPTPAKHTGDTVVNLSVEKGLFDMGDYGRLKLRANINNIFDSNNEAYLDYPGPGRNFYVGLVYSY